MCDNYTQAGICMYLNFKTIQYKICTQCVLTNGILLKMSVATRFFLVTHTIIKHNNYSHLGINYKYHIIFVCIAFFRSIYLLFVMILFLQNIFIFYILLSLLT